MCAQVSQQPLNVNCTAGFSPNKHILNWIKIALKCCTILDKILPVLLLHDLLFFESVADLLHLSVHEIQELLKPIAERRQVNQKRMDSVHIRNGLGRLSNYPCFGYKNELA